MAEQVTVGNNKWGDYEEGSVIDAIQGRAAELPLPERFSAVIQAPTATIFDSVTKKSLKVGLCDYHGAVAALNFADNIY